MTKLANQIIVGATMAGVAEALHFAAVGGADPAAVRKALMGGFADSRILNIHGERMVERDFVTVLDCLVGLFGDMIDAFGTGLDVAGILQEVERRSSVVQAKSLSARVPT